MDNLEITCCVTKSGLIGRRVWSDKTYVDLEFPIDLKTHERYDPKEKISAFSTKDIEREATPEEEQR